jgi:hypothetical protein
MRPMQAPECTCEARRGPVPPPLQGTFGYTSGHAEAAAAATATRASQLQAINNEQAAGYLSTVVRPWPKLTPLLPWARTASCLAAQRSTAVPQMSHPPSHSHLQKDYLDAIPAAQVGGHLPGYTCRAQVPKP